MKFICPLGYFCTNAASGTSREPCIATTYNPKYGATDNNWCLPCPSGQVCPEGTGEIQIDTITCNPGDYCDGGDAVPCPIGFYCNTTYPFKYSCPVGTFSIKEKLVSESECEDCTAGYYCDVEAMDHAPGDDRKCQAGYYCELGKQ